MSEAEFHEMREPNVEKVVVHMGVGEGGRELANAEDILEDVTEQQSVRTLAKSTLPDFGIRQGDPIGAKVTLRGEDAHEFLETALSLVSLSSNAVRRHGQLQLRCRRAHRVPEPGVRPEHRNLRA